MQNIAHNFTTADSTATSAQTYRIVINGDAENIAIGRITDIPHDYSEKITVSTYPIMFFMDDDDMDDMDDDDMDDMDDDDMDDMDDDDMDDTHTVGFTCVAYSTSQSLVNGIMHYGHIYIPSRYDYMSANTSWIEPIDSFLGATFDKNNASVMVYDENNSLIFMLELNQVVLNQQGVQYTLNRTIDVNNYQNLTDYTVISRDEFGDYFDGDLNLTVPFDPSKLSFGYTHFQNKDYIDTIFYDGIEIQSTRKNSCVDNSTVNFYKNLPYAWSLDTK